MRPLQCHYDSIATQIAIRFPLFGGVCKTIAMSHRHAFRQWGPNEATSPSPRSVYVIRVVFMRELALEAVLSKEQTTRLLTLAQWIYACTEKFTLQSYHDLQNTWKAAEHHTTPVSTYHSRHFWKCHCFCASLPRLILPSNLRMSLRQKCSQYTIGRYGIEHAIYWGTLMLARISFLMRSTCQSLMEDHLCASLTNHGQQTSFGIYKYVYITHMF